MGRVHLSPQRRTVGKSKSNGGKGGNGNGNGHDSEDGNGSGNGKLHVARRGRPRVPGQDPVAILTPPPELPLTPSSPSSSPSSPLQLVVKRRKPLDRIGIDTYLDDAYLDAERKKQYRAEDFHVTIKNEFDHDEPLHLRMHPVMKAAMAEMVESKEFPIRSIQAIFLVGGLELMRKLHYIRDQRKTESERPGPNWLVQIETISRIELQEEQSRCFQGSLDRLKRNVDKLLELGEFGEQRAAVEIMKVRSVVKRMEVGWGDWYLSQIDGRWGELLKRNRKRVKVLRGEQCE